VNLRASVGRDEPALAVRFIVQRKMSIGTGTGPPIGIQKGPPRYGLCR
jgi:hypothetical protein